MSLVLSKMTAFLLKSGYNIVVFDVISRLLLLYLNHSFSLDIDKVTSKINKTKLFTKEFYLYDSKKIMTSINNKDQASNNNKPINNTIKYKTDMGMQHLPEQEHLRLTPELSLVKNDETELSSIELNSSGLTTNSACSLKEVVDCCKEIHASEGTTLNFFFKDKKASFGCPTDFTCKLGSNLPTDSIHCDENDESEAGDYSMVKENLTASEDTSKVIDNMNNEENSKQELTDVDSCEGCDNNDDDALDDPLQFKKRFQEMLRKTESRQWVANSEKRHDEGKMRSFRRAKTRKSAYILHMHEQLEKGGVSSDDTRTKTLEHTLRRVNDIFENSRQKQRSISRSGRVHSKGRRAFISSSGKKERPFRHWLGVANCVTSDSRFIISTKDEQQKLNMSTEPTQNLNQTLDIAKNDDISNIDKMDLSESVKTDTEGSTRNRSSVKKCRFKDEASPVKAHEEEAMPCSSKEISIQTQTFDDDTVTEDKTNTKPRDQTYSLLVNNIPGKADNIATSESLTDINSDLTNLQISKEKFSCQEISSEKTQITDNCNSQKLNYKSQTLPASTRFGEMLKNSPYAQNNFASIFSTNFEKYNSPDSMDSYKKLMTRFGEVAPYISQRSGRLIRQKEKEIIGDKKTQNCREVECNCLNTDATLPPTYRDTLISTKSQLDQTKKVGSSDFSLVSPSVFCMNETFDRDPTPYHPKIPTYRSTQRRQSHSRVRPMSKRRSKSRVFDDIPRLHVLDNEDRGIKLWRPDTSTHDDTNEVISSGNRKLFGRLKPTSMDIPGCSSNKPEISSKSKVLRPSIAKRVIHKINIVDTEHRASKYVSVKATSDFNGNLPGQLSFGAGQVIKMRQLETDNMDGLCYGYYRTGRLRKKKRGLFPISKVLSVEDDAGFTI